MHCSFFLFYSLYQRQRNCRWRRSTFSTNWILTRYVWKVPCAPKTLWCTSSHLSSFIVYAVARLSGPLTVWPRTTYTGNSHRFPLCEISWAPGQHSVMSDWINIVNVSSHTMFFFFCINLKFLHCSSSLCDVCNSMQEIMVHILVHSLPHFGSQSSLWFFLPGFHFNQLVASPWWWTWSAAFSCCPTLNSLEQRKTRH